MRRLGEALVGCWKLSGDAHGETRFEWAEGDRFLLQYVNCSSDGMSYEGQWRWPGGGYSILAMRINDATG
jgi:hypothetical protein